MSSFEINKICAAVLLALLGAMSAILISEILIHPVKLDQNAYVIEVEDATAGPESGAEKALEPIGPLMAAANVQAGQDLAKKLCAQCHTFEKGGANKTGPNLFGVLGGGFAHMANFAYSRVFQEKQGKENWDEEKMNQYLHKPRDYMKGTKMAFAGIKKAEDRANVIAYLKSLM